MKFLLTVLLVSISAAAAPADDLIPLYIRSGSEQSILDYYFNSDLTGKLEICTSIPLRDKEDCYFFLEYLKDTYLSSNPEDEQCIRVLLSGLIRHEQCKANKKGFLLLSQPLPFFHDLQTYGEFLDWIVQSSDSDYKNVLISIGDKLFYSIPDDGMVSPAFAHLLEKYIRTSFTLPHAQAVVISSRIAAKVLNYNLDGVYRSLKQERMN